MKKKRVFLIVLDSVGVGALPDAADFGDEGANTLRRIASSPSFSASNLIPLGLGNIPGVDYLPRVDRPLAAYGKAAERSRGKDTTVGHWEIAGVISPAPLPTFPNGFPEGVLAAFSKKCGRGILCNRPYSGTDVIRDYGAEHLATGSLIVYTSADSVFQIAAHVGVVPLEELYRDCVIARDLLTGPELGVGRVIARPFTGEPGNFTRTSDRRDFSLPPPGRTLPDAIADAGLDVISVGKIVDIFAGRGITRAIKTHSNREGMATTLDLLKSDFHGLCFVNLVDFDMLWGHRQDVDGYAAGFAEFDRWLPSFLSGMHEGDLLIVTADHGCDPGDDSTDHTREYIPILLYGAGVSPISLGIRDTFSDIGATVADALGVPFDCPGRSMLPEVTPV